MPSPKRLILSASALFCALAGEASALEYMFRSPQQAAAAKSGNGISNPSSMTPGGGTATPPTMPAPTLALVGCRLIGSKSNIELTQAADIKRIEWAGSYHRSGPGAPTYSPRANAIVGDRSNNFQNFVVPMSGPPSGVTSGAIDLPATLTTDALLLAVEGDLPYTTSNVYYDLISFRLVLASGASFGC